jgi:hypothetical protein
VVSLAASAANARASYTVTPICASAGQTAPCSSSWYTSPVLVSWTWQPLDGIPSAGCLVESYYPSDAAAQLSCEVTGGGVTSVSQNINVETSNPTASATLSRPPDSNGWYNHPVTLAVSGSAFSGIASCTAPTYAGPASVSAELTGTCVDNAGKTTKPVSVAFSYDSTGPALTAAAEPGDGSVAVRWQASANVAPLTSVTLTRSPGLRHAKHSVLSTGRSGAYEDGRVRNGARYDYTLTVRDQAGNVAVRSFTVDPGPQLLAPAPDAHVSAPPLLRWTAVRGAAYYNVQLFGGAKMLSAWPTHPSLRLARSWSYAGRRYRLRPGRYRWYVWPGYGNQSADRYGAAIGAGTFVVTR